MSGSLEGGFVSGLFSSPFNLFLWLFNSNSTLRNPTQYRRIPNAEMVVAKEGRCCFWPAIFMRVSSSLANLRTWYVSLLLDTVISSSHLEVGKNEPALIPRKSGWTRAISFVGLSQSCYRLQMIVAETESPPLIHRMARRFRRPGDTRRNSRVGRNTTFCAIVCCELFFYWLLLERFCIFKDLFKAL